ncbi:glycosyltransferase family 2 protein [Desulfovibrio subterraneus]|uniref:glycosyltransferase family 2 protein n=1 Tax=Desulfovibrio subterraneus TaxID=2718620 RepID=UPI002FD0EBD6
MKRSSNPFHAMRLAIVILHYGKTSLTRRLHAQLLQSDPALAEQVFVLDNCAPEQYPDAWLRTDENLYWAGALQLALQKMDAAGYTHVWFLNNDVLFASTPPFIKRAEGRLKRLNTVLGSRGVGVYAPAVLSNPYHPQMVRKEGMQYRTVTYVDGIAPLISVDCWRELGGVDSAGNPYGYGVDVWFSLCAHEAGWHVVVDHEVAVKHIYHSTAREISGFMQTAALAEQSYLAARLGVDYKTRMDSLKQDWQDHAGL